MTGPKEDSVNMPINQKEAPNLPTGFLLFLFSLFEQERDHGLAREREKGNTPHRFVDRE